MYHPYNIIPEKNYTRNLIKSLSSEQATHAERKKDQADQAVCINEYGEKSVYLDQKELNLRMLDLRLSYKEEKGCLILNAPGMESMAIPVTVPEFYESQVKSFP